MSGRKPMSSIRSASSRTTHSSASRIKRPPVDQVDDAAGSADHDLGTTAKMLDLAADRLAAIDGHRGHPAPTGQLGEFVANLNGQLARRHEDQGPRFACASRRCRISRARGCRKRPSCPCRSGPGPSGRALERLGNQPGLNGRRFLVSGIGQRLQHVVGKDQVAERAEAVLRSRLGLCSVSRGFFRSGSPWNFGCSFGFRSAEEFNRSALRTRLDGPAVGRLALSVCELFFRSSASASSFSACSASIVLRLSGTLASSPLLAYGSPSSLGSPNLLALEVRREVGFSALPVRPVSSLLSACFGTIASRFGRSWFLRPLFPFGLRRRRSGLWRQVSSAQARLLFRFLRRCAWSASRCDLAAGVFRLAAVPRFGVQASRSWPKESAWGETACELLLGGVGAGG